MGKLILQMQTSVDGYISRNDGSLDWLIWDFSDNWTWDAALKKEFNRTIESVDCILLSGKMASEGYIDHWSGMGKRLSENPDFDFARRIESIPKVIFSKKRLEPKWKNTSLSNRGLSREIASIKKQSGGDLIVFGGSSFASALLEAALVDELQLFLNPSILGSGISIFKNLTDKRLHLDGAKGFQCGISVLTFSLNK
jgi:dihydrofolate reductase